MSDKEKEIKRIPAKDSPWGKFLLATIELDKAFPNEKHNDKPNGLHWLLAFEYLTGLKLSEIQKKLPKKHPYKSENVKHFKASPRLKDAAQQLKKQLKISGDIKEINFSRLEFDKETCNFFLFVFPIKVSFTESLFCAVEDSHEKADSSKKIDFVNLDDVADFRDTVFCEDADFAGVIFENMAHFHRANFNGDISFAGAKFEYIACFISTKFFCGANFSKVKFINGLSFYYATFYRDAFFASMKTESHADFLNTKFKRGSPDFYDATLYPGVRWDYDLNLWPNPKKNNDSGDDKKHKATLKRNQDTYENLVFHMKKLERYHDEHFFFRHEMRCRKELAKGNPLVYFAYWLYETFSDYGYGIVQALLWWAGHILAGAILLLAHYFFNSTVISLNDLSCSLGISFSNAHSILSLHKGPLMSCYDSLKGLYLYNIIWGVQTILGVLFLFLVLLTLRTRFRLR